MNDWLGGARGWMRWLYLVAVAVFAGCGQTETGGTVDGKISYQGVPVAGGSVLFFPDSGPTATANFGPDGVYKLLNAHKTEFIAPGGYRVVVMPRSRSQGGKFMEHRAVKLPIPIEFTSITTTPLRYEVKDGPNTIDIELNAVLDKAKGGK